LRLGLVVVLVSALCSTAAAAQEAPAGRGAAGSDLLLERHFVAGAPADSATVLLDEALMYRAELIGRSGVLQLQPTAGRGNAAFLALLTGASAPGRRVYEVYPLRRGEHLLRVTGLAAGDSLTVRLLGDSVGSDARIGRRREAKRRRWTIGLQLGGVKYSDFEVGVGAASGNGIGPEGGILIGNSASRVSVFLGAGHQPAPESRYAFTWFFLEPRVRLARVGRSSVAVLGRLGRGNGGDRVTVDPSYAGGGVALTHRFSSDEGNSGFSAELRYVYGGIGNVPVRGQQLHLLSLGAAWTP
jgi:hypothetical protein